MNESSSQSVHDSAVAVDVSRRRAVRLLLLIVALGLSLRVYHAVRAVIISPDSAVFIAYARQIGDDPLAAARAFAGRQHPLYPAMILVFHEPLRWFEHDAAAGWVLAGRIVAIVGSVCAILAMYWLSAWLMDRRRALIAAAMLAVLPDACRIGADVLSDLPHLALYLAGLAAVLSGLQTGRGRLLVISAAAAGLAFLTRPEGVSVLVVGLAALLLERSWRLRRRAAIAVGMLVSFACVAGPYQLATGKLIPKKSPLEFLQLGDAAHRAEPPPIARTSERNGAERVLASSLPVPVNVLRQWFRAGRVVYILLAIVGVAVAWPRRARGRVLGLAIGLHVILLHALEMRYGYLDRRHALILAALSLPLAAAGVWWLACRFAERCKAPAHATQNRVVVGILMLCVLATGCWLIKPINADETYVAAASRWVSEHTNPAEVIVTDDRLHRVALCADRRFVRWPWWAGRVGDLKEFLVDKPTCWFLVDSAHIARHSRSADFFGELKQAFGKRMKLIHTESNHSGGRCGEIRMYRWMP